MAPYGSGYTPPAQQLFVGRASALAALSDAYDQTCQGSGGLALVAGEAGIGKTTLVNELAASASRLGGTVLWANCWEGEGTPAFWPWIDLIRSYAAQREATALCDELGEGGGEITRLVPQLMQICPDLAVEPVLEHEASRFNLFDSLVGFLRRASDSRPLLLVMDDLHWADMPSLQLLRFAAIELRSSRVLIVGTYREVEIVTRGPLAWLLGELTGPLQQITLLGLNLGEVSELLTYLVGADVGAEEARAVHARTNGNPFFVREIVRFQATQAGAVDSVPIAIREVIERRTERLAPDCRSLLQAASVIGQELELGLLSEVGGLTVPETTELLREAAGARLVDMTVGIARFAHALVRETLYLSLDPTRRRRLHRRAATAIERRYGGDLGGHLAELAHHCRQAGGRTDLSRAQDYATRASERSIGMFAYEHAASHLELALQTLALVAPERREKAGQLYLALGKAQIAAADREAGLRSLQHAAEIARELGDGELLTQTALSLGDEFLASLAGDLELQLLSEALASVERGDGSLRAMLLARLARALLFTPQVDRRVQLAEEATTMARRLNDPLTLAAVLCDRHLANWFSDPPGLRLAMADEVVDLAERSGDHALAWVGRGLRLGDLMEVGNQERLRSELDTYARLLDERRRLQHLWHVPLVRATLAALAGDFEEAERLTGEGLRVGRRFQQPMIDTLCEGVLSCSRLMQGRLGESVDRLGLIIQAFPAIALPPKLVLIIALSDAGRQEEARTFFERLVASGALDLPRDHTFVFHLALFATACHRMDAVEPAGALYEMLLPHGHHNVNLLRIGSHCLGSAHHYLGLLATTLGRWDDAVDHLDAAAAANTRQGFLAAAVHSNYHLGRALVQRGREGDRHRGRSLIAEAQAAAARHGISLTRELGRAPRVAGADHPLSARELEIAELVAQGLSNQEIAGRLFISKRTAETHVDHIKNKLGLTTRAQLVAWVLGRPERSRRDG
jgi:DNA-binding CsgD family transcriptional regulator/tetratricopeptide (TPR) repeat protein